MAAMTPARGVVLGSERVASPPPKPLDPFEDSMFHDETLSDEDLESSEGESKDSASHSSPTSASAPPAAPAAEDALFLAYYKRDPHLLCHKAIYFLGMGANSAYFPFFVQWVTSPTVGLTVAQAGYVFAAAHICTMVASPLMMRLADQSAAWRRGVLLCSIPTQIALLWVMSQCRSFWSVLVVEVLQECMSCAIWPSMDAATQRLLEVVHGNTHLYGNTRAFGAIGWGLCAWIFGAIFDMYGMDVWWYLFAGTFAPAMLLATLVPVETRSASRASNGELLKRVWRWEVGVVVFVVLLTAVLLQIVDIYRFPFLASLPGCTNQLLGLSVAATAVSEAPFFFITSWVLARMSVKWALCLVLLGYFVRYIYYSLIYDPWLTIPAELMHGVTFALCWAASTQYMASLMPPELSSSAQGLLSGLQWGVGASLGSVLGGSASTAFGWRGMWRLGAGLSLVGVLLMCWEVRKDNSSSTMQRLEEQGEGEGEEEEEEEEEEEGGGGEEVEVEVGMKDPRGRGKRDDADMVSTVPAASRH